MARETLDYQDRIIQDPKIMVGKPVIKGTRIPVESVLAHLADNLDVPDLLDAYPELTRDDVRAVLAYAHARVADRSGFQSPQDFYREMTQREDVRRILSELAK